jgi:hypothetical protein
MRDFAVKSAALVLGAALRAAAFTAGFGFLRTAEFKGGLAVIADRVVIVGAGIGAAAIVVSLGRSFRMALRRMGRGSGFTGSGDPSAMIPPVVTAGAGADF